MARRVKDKESGWKKRPNFYQTTQRYNPEDSHLRTHCRENLKSYNNESLGSKIGGIYERFYAFEFQMGSGIMIKASVVPHFSLDLLLRLTIRMLQFQLVPVIVVKISAAFNSN
jgi:hypothetical protein